MPSDSLLELQSTLLEDGSLPVKSLDQQKDINGHKTFLLGARTLTGNHEKHLQIAREPSASNGVNSIVPLIDDTSVQDNGTGAVSCGMQKKAIKEQTEVIWLPDLKVKTEAIDAKYENEESEQEEEGVYEVEYIMDHMREDGVDWFLVKWKNWEVEFRTWETRDKLISCQEAISEYFNRQQQEPDLIKKGTKRQKLMGSLNLGAEEEVLKDFIASFFKPTKEDFQRMMDNHRDITKLRLLPEGVLKKELLQAARSKRRKASDIKKFREQLLLREFQKKRKEQMDAMKQWEMQINAMSEEQACITVENFVDLDGPPENFIYVSDYMPSPGIEIPDDPIIGCDCKVCGDDCCGTLSGSMRAYTRFGRLRVSQGTPIYECNKRCSCGADCSNRVVQNGRKVKLCIFRTANGCGWGVKALEQIKQFMFVTEYVGEVITSEAAERRGEKYDAEGRTYLFDLDYNAQEDEQCPYTVDAAKYGNISHFINHSCDPNLAVFGVWINCLDPNLPKLALFATRDIKRGEEITFDYMSQALNYNKSMTADARSGKSSGNQRASPSKVGQTMKDEISVEGFKGKAKEGKIQCKCGASNCRKYLF